MKMFYKKLIWLAVIILISTTGIAQKFNLSLNYNIAVPLSGSFKDYVSKTSFRGFQGSVLYDINSQFRVGLQASYNDFYEKYARQVYKTTDGSDISTVLSNTLQNIPVLIKGEHSLLKSGLIRPYIGLGAGVNFIRYDQFYGELEYSHYYTKAAFTGDVGIVIPFSKTSHYGARISSSYNLTPFNEEGIKRIDTWNVQAGVIIPLK